MVDGTTRVLTSPIAVHTPCTHPRTLAHVNYTIRESCRTSKPESSNNFELVSRHIPNYHAICNCKPVHTDQNLNVFPLSSLLLGYKYHLLKNDCTFLLNKQTSLSSLFL